jgi:hypothetical protein
MKVIDPPGDPPYENGTSALAGAPASLESQFLSKREIPTNPQDCQAVECRSGSEGRHE